MLLPILLLGGCAPQTPQGTGSSMSSPSAFSIVAMSSSQKGLSGKPLRGTANVPAEDLQQHVNQMQSEETQKCQAELLQEAISAVAETRNAVVALEKKDTRAALTAMERVTSKLDIILTQEPTIALAALDSAQQVAELQADPVAIDAIRAQARAFMAQDDIQRSRQLLSTLESEIQVSTLNIPLKTYPDAMKEPSMKNSSPCHGELCNVIPSSARLGRRVGRVEGRTMIRDELSHFDIAQCDNSSIVQRFLKQAVKLLDQGKLDESKAVLETALNTLVITQHSIPIPLLNAQYELDQATKEVARNRNRAKALLEDARFQIVLAEKLGYGKLFADPEALPEQIRDANATLAANQGSGGLLDALKADWRT